MLTAIEDDFASVLSFASVARVLTEALLGAPAVWVTLAWGEAGVPSSRNAAQ